MVINMTDDLIMVIFRTILVLSILFILTKVMGKKQVSQMNIYDYIIGITMGSIAADISLDIKKDLIAGLASLLIYGGSGILVTALTMKNIKIRHFINGTPTILINNGKIIYDNLKKEGIDINDLEEASRQNGYFDLSKVNYAILEISGKISFLSKSIYSYPTKQDMKIKSSDEHLKANIIIDGTLIEKNLKLMNKDLIWLQNELKKRGYKDYKNILLCTLDNLGKIIIFDKSLEPIKSIF